MSVVEQYLLQLNKEKRRWRHTVTVLTALSLVVALLTVWNLRMVGIAIANSASCNVEEHTHTASCMQDGELICQKQEHVHGISCYSGSGADEESFAEWQKMFADYPYANDLRKDLVGIAKTQVGYAESQQNYEIRDDGQKYGYTRYGAWYGAPYNDWSAMFVSFCLNFSNADTKEFPISSGGYAMAELWKKQGKFEPLGQYLPQSGDIVFFDNNTVGIVAEVYNATFYVIRGDMHDAVRAGVMSLADISITGWGITGEKSNNAQQIPDHSVSGDEVLDISGGPSLQIFEGGTSPSAMQTYSLRSLRSSRAVIDLLTYLLENEGSYFFTLLDHNNTELPKDTQGNYIAQANTGYKLTISFNSPEGFLPGTYRYQVPNGLMVDGGEGNFVLKDGTNVGYWSVTDTGLITLVFNENMNSRSEITISATLGINFPEQSDPIDFDGKITVTVEPPPTQKYPTKLTKWGHQGDAHNAEDPSKIYWTVQIEGNKDSMIPGNILSDQIFLGEWSKTHRYTASDIAGGLSFGVSEPDPITGAFKDWHAWHVDADDPRLIWTENGWSYKIPETITCQWCGEVKLGNQNWIYSISYTSTPDPLSIAGKYGYENIASVDGQQVYAWADFTHGEAFGKITKIGSLVTDANGGNYVWEFQAMIPGRKQGQKAEYHWYIMDYMYLMNPDGYHVGYMKNDANLALVTAYFNGTTVQVPNIRDATENDMFAWHNAWTANSNGVNYGQEINILCRCNCNKDNCQFWNGRCENYWYDRGDGEMVTNGFCQCWTVEENVTFTFAYTTDALSVIEKYGGLDYRLQNIAELYYKPIESTSGALVSSSDVSVSIPGLFEKELTHDFNGYTAHYKITVNEAKAVLTNGTELTIHDVMTDTLAYISGSLVIKAEDENGNISTLRQGQHYTVTYDGTGSQTDELGQKVHVLDIVILHPQPVMYILEYDTTLIMPEHVTEGIKYKNSATIYLWGRDITNTSVEKVYADINIAARSYKVEVFKTCALTNKPLAGVMFGLYNAQGGLIATGETDQQGRLLFQTSVINGIILREHLSYYLQELRPAPGYSLDDSKHWFCFCSGTQSSCDACNMIISEVGAVRIPFDQIGIIDIVNFPTDQKLPMTGGVGNNFYILCGLALVSSPFIYVFRQRQKTKRKYTPN